jgi:hypothetical protein
MTPGSDWRSDYGGCRPRSRSSLTAIARCTRSSRATARSTTGTSRAAFSRTTTGTRRGGSPAPQVSVIARDLRRSLPDASEQAPAAGAGRCADRKLERQLMADVFRWTGCFPEDPHPDPRSHRSGPGRSSRDIRGRGERRDRRRHDPRDVVGHELRAPRRILSRAVAAVLADAKGHAARMDALKADAASRRCEGRHREGRCREGRRCESTAFEGRRTEAGNFRN